MGDFVKRTFVKEDFAGNVETEQVLVEDENTGELTIKEVITHYGFFRKAVKLFTGNPFLSILSGFSVRNTSGFGAIIRVTKSATEVFSASVNVFLAGNTNLSSSLSIFSTDTSDITGLISVSPATSYIPTWNDADYTWTEMDMTWDDLDE